MSLSIGPVLLPSLTEPLGNSPRSSNSNGPGDQSKDDSPNAIAAATAASAAGSDPTARVVATPQVINAPDRQPERGEPQRQDPLTEQRLASTKQPQQQSLNETITSSIEDVYADKVSQSKTTSLNEEAAQVEFSTSRLGIDLNQFQPSAKQKGIAESGFQSSIFVPDWLKGVTIDDLISQLREPPAETQQKYTEQRSDLTGDASALAGRQLDVLA